LKRRLRAQKLINISQGSVVKRFRCGGIFNDHFIANLLLSLVKNLMCDKYLMVYARFPSFRCRSSVAVSRFRTPLPLRIFFAVYGYNGTEFSYVFFTEQRNFTTAKRQRKNGNGMVETRHYFVRSRQTIYECMNIVKYMRKLHELNKTDNIYSVITPSNTRRKIH